jgi:hypothetical protein
MPNATGYALRGDRRMHRRIIAMQVWLDAPFARFMIPRKKRAELQALFILLTDRVAVVPPPQHVEFTPLVGSEVRLLTDSWYLRDYHGVGAGAIGTVVGHSRNHADDNGVRVDWGDGEGVRCDLDELGLAA